MKPLIIRLLLLVVSIGWGVGCVGPRMSVEEAKEVAITVEKEPFVPPPRRVYDVLSVLDEGGTFDRKILRKHQNRMVAPLPDTDDDKILALSLLKRANSALESGYPKQAVVDLRTALIHAERYKNFPKMGSLLFRLGQAELQVGNVKHGVEMLERSQQKGKGAAYNELVKTYSLIGDIEKARKHMYAGQHQFDQKFRRARRKGKGNIKKNDRREATLSQMQAWYLEGQGKFPDAEPHIRKALGIENEQKNKFPGRSTETRISLANNLMMQGKKFEAEVEIRTALDNAIGFGGKDSILTAQAVIYLGKIVLSQGRVEEAEQLGRHGLDILGRCGLTKDSQLYSETLMLLGDALAAKGDFKKAADRFDEAAAGIFTSPSRYDRLHRNPSYILSLIELGRLEEASKNIKAVYRLEEKYFGRNHTNTQEIIALRGMLWAESNSHDRAYKDLSVSVPRLLQQNIDEKNTSARFRLKAYGDAYLDLLSVLSGSPLEKRLGIDAVSTAFELADALGGRLIQNTLGASSARTLVTDPALADLARKEQDAKRQTAVLQRALSNMMAAPVDQQIPAVIQDLQKRIEALRNAHLVLYRKIGKRFPKYADFIHPRPGTVSAVRKTLMPGEALILVFTSKTRTYVWAVPHTGPVAFTKTDMGRKDMARAVKKIRIGLSTDLNTFGDISPFDVTAAHDLFKTILKPVGPGWNHASDLVVVGYGPMGQIPFGLLPTEAIALKPDTSLLFSNYRDVSWLIRDASVTRTPSVSSFLMLRNMPAASPDRKFFVGFGNPVYNLTQLDAAGGRRPGVSKRSADPIFRLQSRGFRTKQGSSTSVSEKEMLSSLRLEDLISLPDTEAEIRHMAMALNADLASDILLGEDASEQRLKAMDLSDRRVVAFATHALKPGELDGLDQPALALSSPTVTGESDDGLLTAGEIYNLKLNADWVVLSACNTGIDTESEAQSVSGLGRAFFYAGTRSLLVTLWPVETTSARKLTTRLFSLQKKHSAFSRAKALQQAMLDLIDDPGFADPASGKFVSAYAHPFFWAPFVIIGDNG